MVEKVSAGRAQFSPQVTLGNLLNLVAVILGGSGVAVTAGMAYARLETKVENLAAEQHAMRTQFTEVRADARERIEMNTRRLAEYQDLDKQRYAEVLNALREINKELTLVRIRLGPTETPKRNGAP